MPTNNNYTQDNLKLSKIHTRQLRILQHVKEVMKWSPPGRRKRGRPKLTWTEGIRGLMGEKGLMEGDWNARGNWRKKIIYMVWQ